jgi:O-antigen ligase
MVSGLFRPALARLNKKGYYHYRCLKICAYGTGSMMLRSGSGFSKFIFRIFNRQPISYRIGRAFPGPAPGVADLDQTKRYERNHLNLIVLIGGAVFFIPFLFSYATIDPVLSIRFLAWTVLTIIIILIFFIQGSSLYHSHDFTVIYRAIFPIAIGYAVVAGLSLIRAINFADGVFEWLKLLLSYIFLYVTCLILVRNKSGLLILTRSVIVTAFILGLIGICQYFQIAFTGIPGNRAIYATMANPNLFASALFLMLPFIFFGVLQFSSGWYKLSLITLTGVFYALAVSDSRAVWGAIIIASVGTILSVLLGHQKLKLTQNEKKSYLRRLLLILVIFLISFSAAVWSHSTVSTYLCLFLNKSHPATFNNSDPPQVTLQSFTTLNGRFRYWQKSLQMIKAAPILGIGLGQWKIVLPIYDQKIRASRGGRREVRIQRPHNDFLWVWSETGFLGLFGYLLFWGVIIFYSLRVICSAVDIQKKLFTILMLFGIIGFAVISFFSFPKERIFHSIFFMVIVAGPVTIYHQTFPIQKTVKRSKIFFLKLSLLVLLIFCWTLGYTRFEAEAHTKKAIAAYRAKDWQGVITEIDKADCRYYNLDPTSTPLAWYRGMANFSLGRIKEARGDFEKAHANHPYHVHVINNLGTCHAKLQDFNKAIDYYQKALVISPRFEKAIINLGAVYFRMGKYKQARETLLRCIKNNPRSRAAAYLKMVEERIEPSKR